MNKYVVEYKKIITATVTEDQVKSYIPKYQQDLGIVIGDIDLKDVAEYFVRAHPHKCAIEETSSECIGIEEQWNLHLKSCH